MISRQTIREQLATLLRSQVTSASVVFDHEPGDLSGASPAIVVSSAGSNRPRMTFQGNLSTVYLNVDIYTLGAESEGGAYTYADSADVIDSCEQQLATALSANQGNGTWEMIAYDGRSTIDFFVSDSISYFRERIPIVVTFFG